jgi:hypothetical protein
MLTHTGIKSGNVDLTKPTLSSWRGSKNMKIEEEAKEFLDNRTDKKEDELLLIAKELKKVLDRLEKLLYSQY